MSGGAFDQSVDVLRRSEADYKTKCTEVAALRQRLTDVTVSNEKTKVELRKQEIRVEGLTKDVDKRQKAVDIIVKELTSKKQIVEAVQAENARLRKDLESALRTSEGMQGTIHARSVVNNTLSREHDAPATLYMQRCFTVGIDPNVELLRCLFGEEKLSSLAKPATYQELGTLIDILQMKTDVNASSWQTFTSLSLSVDFQETFHQVVELIQHLPSLASIELVGLGDAAAADVAAALSTAENIVSLSLPDLCVTDTGFKHIMKVLANREILSVQKGTPMLIVHDLDLSNCLLTDFGSFQEIHGDCLANISLAGSTILNDAILTQMMRECPSLAKLSLAGCTGLTNAALAGINKSGCALVELDLTGCTGITHIKLDTVRIITTTLCGVTFFDCPAVTALPKPLTHFQCLTFKAPLLQELSLQALSMNAREFAMLTHCSHMTHLSLVNCRLSGLEVFLCRMRRLVKLSIHSCKGVMDADVMALCSTIDVLDLSECYCVTDKALVKVADTCRGLTELTVKRCSNITDAGIMSLEKCTSLEYLNVLGAKKVSVIALHRIISACPSLLTVVHESLISANVRVDHNDEEESRRDELTTHAKDIFVAREQLGFQFHAVASPTKPSTSSGSRLNTPAAGDIAGRRWIHSSSSGVAAGGGSTSVGNVGEGHSPIPRPPTRDKQSGADDVSPERGPAIEEPAREEESNTTAPVGEEGAAAAAADTTVPPSEQPEEGGANKNTTEEKKEAPVSPVVTSAAPAGGVPPELSAVGAL